MVWSDAMALETRLGYRTERLDVVGKGDPTCDPHVSSVKNRGGSGAIDREMWRLRTKELQSLREEIQSSALGTLRFPLDIQVGQGGGWGNETGTQRRGLGWG